MSVHKYAVTPESNTTVGDGLDTVGIQEGMPRGSVSNAMRSMTSDIAKNYKDHGSLVTAGTGSAYTVLAQSDFSAYFVGMSIVVRLHANCAGGATINVNGLGPKNLRMRGTSGVTNVEADSLRANEVIHLVYNGAHFHVLGAFDYASIQSRIAALETRTSTGTVHDAANLNGNPGSFYQNAGNLTEGILPSGRLSGSYNITVTSAASAGSATNATNADNATNLGSNSAAFYRNADNLNAGRVPNDRLTGTYDISVSSAVTAGSATTAGNANTVGSLSASQFLRSDASDTTTGTLTVEGDVRVGRNGGGNTDILFYDDNSNTYRSLRWSDNLNAFQLEGNDGALHLIRHSGNEGHGSGVDADTVDNRHASDFVLASAGAGDLNTYAMLRRDTGNTSPITFGQTQPGSVLSPANSSGGRDGTRPPGTWMCMGYVSDNSSTEAHTTNWKRVL